MSKRSRLYILLSLAGLSAQLGWAQVDFTTLSNKVVTGYQGWHWAKGDLSPFNNWNHWCGSDPAQPSNCHMDMYPDMTEYTKSYPTLYQRPDGTPMRLYSAADYSTVDLHFKWMRDYNIDAAFVQRFISRFKTYSTSAQNTDIVLSNCWKAAEAYGRAFVVMYDVSNTWDSDAQLYTTITNDWIKRARKYTTNSPNYLYHKGKPLVVVWGMGKTDRRPESPRVAMDIVNFFKTNGCTIMGGVDDGWRTLDGCRNNVDGTNTWTGVNNAYDVISPWLVGTFGAGTNAADGIRSKLTADVNNCNSRNVDYMPVVFPGFSWSNWQDGAGDEFNKRPRIKGEYLWRQAYNAKTTGSKMLYLAMFDEVDEATALYKTTTTSNNSPKVIFTTGYTNRWVRLDIDGYNLPSDFYLKVCNEINRMFKGERPPVGSVPVTTNSAPVVISVPGTKVDISTAVLSGTPTGANAGSNLVSLQVSDGAVSVTQNFTIAVVSRYAAWAATNGVGSADSDQDGDGRNNLYEYALYGNPTNILDSGVDPLLIMTGHGIEYIHLRRNGDTNLIYTVETRTNLLSGVWTTNGTSVLSTNSYNADYNEITHSVSITNTQSYIRLKVENR